MTNEDARRFDELDTDVKDLLRRMEPQEVETLKYLASIPKDEVRGMMKLYRDVKSVSRFFRWLILAVLGLFLTTVTIGENIAKVWAWFKTGGPQ